MNLQLPHKPHKYQDWKRNICYEKMSLHDYLGALFFSKQGKHGVFSKDCAIYHISRLDLTGVAFHWVFFLPNTRRLK